MALAPGSDAPEFALPAAGDGNEVLSLADLTAEGPALLAFFKTSCPTCQLSFPVWGELARRYGDDVRVAAIAQDPLGKAREWLDGREFEAPVLDDSDGYVVSKAYDLDAVPALVLVDPDGKVVESSEGWHRDRANSWDTRLAELAGRPSPGPLSPEDDGRPPMKPG